MKPISIQLKSILWLGVMALLLPVTRAHAAITCSVSAPGFVTGYDAAAITINSNQTYFTVTCNRASAADPTSVNYSAAVNNGLQPVGINNRAAFGASLIKYDTFADAACATLWKSNKPIAGTITFGTTIGPLSTQTAFWGCIPAAQAGLPAGTYTDTVTLTLSYGPLPQATASSSFPVSITPPADCKITTAPGNIVFTYTAFGIAQAASTTFGITCTNRWQYTMALDATSGVVSGLQYSLTLSAASSTGTGFSQTHSINGTMPAGQAGTCATATCTGTQLHTLTVTY